ncbi:MAG: hypothetical protein IKB20_02700 [Clostridia bacterium]|nr:hypothetical protein [Clostridia bacterium]
MKIRFVSRVRVKAFKDGYESEGEDLILFGFNGMGVVSYEQELSGESGFFEETALLSKSAKAVVVCGCVTDTRGIKRKSALVAENGRLCGICDMLHALDGEVSVGAGLKIYSTKIGRMGVVVADDIAFPEAVKSLALCSADFIVCPFGRVQSTLQQVLLRAYAYLYGVPIFFCGEGYCAVANTSGSIAFSSPYSPVSVAFDSAQEYHLIQTRQRISAEE